ncbi:small heat shock protein C4-like [Chrysoperla carnea]|uniref:small heat shock protein C4-like n=1 Tax=Chrysoperla carnea TaxID=189513 RepID=UPI001D08EF88|nr:small heat shock protein C4-like [Chrysoperla carnea]
MATKTLATSTKLANLQQLKKDRIAKIEKQLEAQQSQLLQKRKEELFNIFKACSYMQKFFIILGLLITTIGLAWPLISRLKLGRLPGELFFQKENDSEYNLEMELPGITQDNIDLKIDSNILTIEGKKEQSPEKKDHNYHMQERYYGSFYRSISLPSNIDEEHIEAQFKDGILSIKIPKKEQSKAKKI